VIGKLVAILGRERTEYVTGVEVLSAYLLSPEYVAVNG
jgi:hypothetical protein